MMKKLVPYAIAGSVALWAVIPPLNAQLCPSSCPTSIVSDTLRFCRCTIYTGGSSDRIQLITDRSVTIVDVDGDGLRDIPFGVWAYGNQGAYVLKQTSPGIPGSFTAYRISSHPTYGITTIGDINGDSIKDFAIAGHWANYSVYMLLSDGAFPSYYDTLIRYHTGSHNAPNSIAGHGGLMYWSAYDGSISFYNAYTNTLVVRNDSLCGDGVAFGDFNGDGYEDAACSNRGWPRSNHGIYLYYFDGSSFYTADTVDTTRKWQGILAYDINGDGLSDIIAVGEDASIWFNRGGYFEELRIDDNLSAGSNPFARVNIADLDCDGDMDIVATTSCPPSGGAILKWYEQVDTTTWLVHPIDFGGNDCSSTAPYPYGVRVGLLNETTDTGRADIVIVRGNRNIIEAYYNVSPINACRPLAWEGDLGTSEDRPHPRWSVVPSPDGITVMAARPIRVKIYDSAGRLLKDVRVPNVVRIPLPSGVFFAVGEGRDVRRVVVR